MPPEVVPQKERGSNRNRQPLSSNHPHGCSRTQSSSQTLPCQNPTQPINIKINLQVGSPKEKPSLDVPSIISIRINSTPSSISLPLPFEQRIMKPSREPPSINLKFINNLRFMSLKLASGSYDNTVRFWDPSNGNCNPAETIKLDSAPICLQITDRKDKVVIGMNNAVKIFDISKPTAPVRSFETAFKGNVNAVGCFSKEDKLIYTACEDGGLRILDMKSKNVVKEHKNNKPINCAALHPNEGSIVFGDEGGFVSKWDLYKDTEHKTTIESDYSIRTITMSDTLERMAFGDNEGYINLYSEHMTKKNPKPVKVHDDYILKMKISPNNKYLATCSADKKIKLFKINMENDNFTITEHKTLKGHLKWVWDCQFSCDEAYLITCSTDMTIKLWQVEKGELVQNLKGHEKGVICLALNDIAD